MTAAGPVAPTACNPVVREVDGTWMYTCRTVDHTAIGRFASETAARSAANVHVRTGAAPADGRDVLNVIAAERGGVGLAEVELFAPGSWMEALGDACYRAGVEDGTRHGVHDVAVELRGLSRTTSDDVELAAAVRALVVRELGTDTLPANEDGA